jgi:hypothetical protein
VEVDIFVALIKTLGLTELVSDALASRKQKEAETNAKIVDPFKEALDEIKNCRTEQHSPYESVCQAVFPTRTETHTRANRDHKIGLDDDSFSQIKTHYSDRISEDDEKAPTSEDEKTSTDVISIEYSRHT